MNMKQRPVCVKCGREMQCFVNEVIVYHPSEPEDEYNGEIDFAVYGDLWKCPGCAIEIVSGFGETQLSKDAQELYDQSKDKRQMVKILRMWVK